MDSEQKDSERGEAEAVSGDVRLSVREDDIEVIGLTNPRESLPETTEDTGQTIGKKIAGLRNKRDKNQSELAEEIGKTNSWLSKVESGNMRFMVEDLISIADTLEVPLRRLTPTDQSSSQEALADDFIGSNDGTVFLLKLGGAGMEVAVSGSVEEESEEIQSQVRKKIARRAGRIVAKAVIRYFRLEQERIEKLIEKHSFIRDGVEKGYEHVVNTCRKDGETVLTVRIVSPGETSFDQEGSVMINLEMDDEKESGH